MGSVLIFVCAMMLFSCSEEEHVCTPNESWVTVTSASCSSTGMRVRRCIKCRIVMEEEIIPETEHTPGEWMMISDSDCTQEGLMEAHCQNCNAIVASEVVPKKAHQLSDWQIKTEATCVEEGILYQECLTCHEYTEEKNYLGEHHVITVPALQATCLEDGYTAMKYCDVCSIVLAEQKPVEAKGHSWVIDKAVLSTCAAYGYTEGEHCSSCAFVKVAQVKLDKEEHVVVADAAVEPTCDTVGYTEGSHCKICNEAIIKQKTVSALGHDYSKLTNTCSKCSGKEYPEYWSLEELVNASDSDENKGAVIYFDYLALNPSLSYTITIEKDCPYIRLVGNINSTYNNVRFVTEERTTDLKIDLVNMNLIPSIQNDHLFKINSTATVHFGFYGDYCFIEGMNGSKGDNRTLGTAGNGSAGKSAIDAEKATVKITIGTEHTYIVGGDGGNGGKGSMGASGGNGGNGGVAIYANKIEVCFEEGYSASNLTILGGEGGEKGKASVWPGDDGKKGSSAEPTNVPIIYE